MKLRQQLSKEESAQAFFDLNQLGERWHCHRMTAYRRLIRLGVKPMKLSGRSVLIRTSDVELIEAACIT